MSIASVMPSAISLSDALFSFCPQSFPEPGTFPMSQLFESEDQNTGVSASASVHPMSIQGWFPWRLTGLTSLLCKGLSRVLSSTAVQRHQFFSVRKGHGAEILRTFQRLSLEKNNFPYSSTLPLKKKTLYFIVNISPCVYVLSSTNSDWTETEVDMWMLLNFPFPSSLARGKERRWEWIWGLEEAGSRGCLSSCVSGETWARKVVICFPSTHSWWLCSASQNSHSCTFPGRWWLCSASQNSHSCMFLGRVGHKRHVLRWDLESRREETAILVPVLARWASALV